MYEDLSGFQIEDIRPVGLGDADPVVTVVTVVFRAIAGGRKQILRECLDSVQRQEGVPIEHLVIDGGSDDGTVDFVRAGSAAQAPIRLLSAPDEGIYHAMNRGISLARGKYVLFLNSDDRLNGPRALADMADLAERTGSDFAYAPAIVIGPDGPVADHPYARACPYSMGPGMTICHQSILTRRDVLVKMGGFDRSYRFSADFDLLMRMVFAGCKACRLPEPVAVFRIGGCSSDNKLDGYRETGRIYATLFNRHLGTAFDSGFCDRFCRDGYLPEHVLVRYRPFAVRTFGADYAVSAFDRQRLQRIYDARLDRALEGVALKRLVPSRILRGIVHRVCGFVPMLGELMQRRCRREVEESALRVHTGECASGCKDCLLLSSGMEIIGRMDFARRLPAEFCGRRLVLIVLVKGSSTGSSPVGMRVSFRDGTSRVVSIECGVDLQPVEIGLPESAVMESALQFGLEPVVDSTEQDAFLVFGGMAVWK